MVTFNTDPAQIKQELKKNWEVIGQAIINKKSQLVIGGSINPLGYSHYDHLPFKFAKVTVDLTIESLGLQTLEGCPEEVGRHFKCINNNLKNLQGGPRRVNGAYRCYINDLQSLDGMPEHCGEFIFRWTPNLPLLQTLRATKITPLASQKDQEKMQQLRVILNNYAGTTNPADVLRCASELTEHGFEGNAEW